MCTGENVEYFDETCECLCKNRDEIRLCRSYYGRKKIWKGASDCRCECHPSEFKTCSTGTSSQYPLSNMYFYFNINAIYR